MTNHLYAFIYFVVKLPREWSFMGSATSYYQPTRCLYILKRVNDQIYIVLRHQSTNHQIIVRRFQAKCR